MAVHAASTTTSMADKIHIGRLPSIVCASQVISSRDTLSVAAATMQLNKYQYRSNCMSHIFHPTQSAASVAPSRTAHIIATGRCHRTSDMSV